jgi:hypothetical protein
MNPFTRFLVQLLPKEDSSLQAFVHHWDALEALVIRVYRSAMVETADEEEYQELFTWLQENYVHWQDHLQPYWQETKVGGQITAQDPFLRLITVRQAADFVGDWAAMQHLPAAREALNRYISKG